LNKEKESENIVFDDPDPETGFILLPDISFTKPGFSFLKKASSYPLKQIILKNFIYWQLFTERILTH